MRKATVKNENMTPKEAAEYLRCSTEWLQKLRQRGEGPAYAKLGHKVVYRKVDLEAFVAANVVKPSATTVTTDVDDEIVPLSASPYWKPEEATELVK